MKIFFEELFIYNQMVNGKIMDCVLVNKGPLPSRILELVSHIVLVHGSWNQRMSGSEGEKHLWKVLEEKEITLANKANFFNSIEIIKNNPLENNFEYRNTKGDIFVNSFRDVLFHIINHSSYHRGQINAELTRAGLAPAITEYIYYKR